MHAPCTHCQPSTLHLVPFPRLPPQQAKDRLLVQQRMRAHVQRADSTPLLIFPEGTCVNNEYCVMFKRGAFDLGACLGRAGSGCATAQGNV